MVSHHPAKFGSQGYHGSEEIMVFTLGGDLAKSREQKLK